MQSAAANSIEVLDWYKIRISIDGRGAWRNNAFVERLWRSVKDEEVYLHACDSIAAKAGIGRYFACYNAELPHTALDRNTPDNVYSSTVSR